MVCVYINIFHPILTSLSIGAVIILLDQYAGAQGDLVSQEGRSKMEPKVSGPQIHTFSHHVLLASISKNEETLYLPIWFPLCPPILSVS